MGEKYNDAKRVLDMLMENVTQYGDYPSHIEWEQEMDNTERCALRKNHYLHPEEAMFVRTVEKETREEAYSTFENIMKARWDSQGPCTLALGRDMVWACDTVFDTFREAVEAGVEALREYNQSTILLRDNIDLSDLFGTQPEGYNDIHTFYVGRVEKVDPDIRVDELLEQVAERASWDYGEVADDYLEDVEEEHVHELENIIHKWFARHSYLPSFNSIQNITKVEIP